MIYLGKSLNKLNKFEESLNVINKALEIDPYFKAALIDKGFY
jgi:tetratricopeptide (TPR) repeat protein